MVVCVTVRMGVRHVCRFVVTVTHVVTIVTRAGTATTVTVTTKVGTISSLIEIAVIVIAEVIWPSLILQLSLVAFQNYTFAV